MGDYLKTAFLITLDGTKKPAIIKAPSNDYLEGAPHALIKDKLFIFGGWKDSRKVRKLVKPRK